MGLAGELSLPVNLHVTEPHSKNYPGKVETPLGDFVRLACEFPATKFILAHWGGQLPLDPKLGAAARACANLYYDTAASPLLYAEDIWRRCLSAVPKERVLFGSDYPLNVYPRIDAQPDMARMVAEVHRAGLTADELHAVVRANATRLIRW